MTNCQQACQGCKELLLAQNPCCKIWQNWQLGRRIATNLRTQHIWIWIEGLKTLSIHEYIWRGCCKMTRLSLCSMKFIELHCHQRLLNRSRVHKHNQNTPSKSVGRERRGATPLIWWQTKPPSPPGTSHDKLGFKMYSADSREYFHLIFGGKIVSLIALEYCRVSGAEVTRSQRVSCVKNKSNP